MDRDGDALVFFLHKIAYCLSPMIRKMREFELVIDIGPRQNFWRLGPFPPKE